MNPFSHGLALSLQRRNTAAAGTANCLSNMPAVRRERPAATPYIWQQIILASTKNTDLSIKKTARIQAGKTAGYIIKQL